MGHDQGHEAQQVSRSGGDASDFDYTYGAYMGSLMQMALIGLIVVGTLPFWLPMIVADQVGKICRPKPTLRGTVRPWRR